MGYDRSDSFPFDFKPNGIPFGSKSKGKLSQRSYPIQCERKWKYSFLSAQDKLRITLALNYQLIITKNLPNDDELHDQQDRGHADAVILLTYISVRVK